MTNAVQILRIGPIPNASPDARFLYVPVAEETGPEQIISAADDTDGLTKLRAALPDADLVCDPLMASNRADVSIAQALPVSLRELRFDLALAIFEEGRLPPGNPRSLRRFLLRHIGPFIAHPSLLDLLAGGVLTSELHVDRVGRTEDRETTVRATRRGSGGLTLSFTWGSGVVQVDLSPSGEPGYLEAALFDAFRLEVVPQAFPVGVELRPEDWATFYLVAGLTLATAAGMDVSRRSARQEFRFDGIAAEARVRTLQLA